MPNLESSLFLIKRPPPGTKYVPETEYPSADCDICVIGSEFVDVISALATTSTVTDFTPYSDSLSLRLQYLIP